jgi:hypothetical protein
LKDPVTGKATPQIDRLKHYYGPDYHRHSYSGHERNRLFLNREGQSFVDLSGISGADTEADSRSWCALDYDHDGWTDIALVNANTPLLNLFRNRIAKRAGSNRSIAIRLIGGNQGAAASEFSNRDAVGAKITVTVGGRKIHRVRRCGEGFAAQNSATMTIGIGKSETVDRIDIVWPSGKTSFAETVVGGSLIVFSERDGTAVRQALQPE